MAVIAQLRYNGTEKGEVWVEKHALMKKRPFKGQSVVHVTTW